MENLWTPVLDFRIHDIEVSTVCYILQPTHKKRRNENVLLQKPVYHCQINGVTHFCFLLFPLWLMNDEWNYRYIQLRRIDEVDLNYCYTLYSITMANSACQCNKHNTIVFRCRIVTRSRSTSVLTDPDQNVSTYIVPKLWKWSLNSDRCESVSLWKW